MVSLLVVFVVVMLALSYFGLGFVKAVSSWQEVDINNDGQIDAEDVTLVTRLFGCPYSGNCSQITSAPNNSSDQADIAPLPNQALSVPTIQY